MEQSKKSAITRQKILDAAEEVFAECGLAAARVDAIAKEAGVNKQMIYAHFGSKEGLYQQVLQMVYARIAENEKILQESEFTGIETIRNIVMDYFDFHLKDQNFVRLILWENLNYGAYIEQVDTKLFAGVERLLEEGIQKGVLRKDLDVRQTAMSLNLFCFSAFSNVHTLSKLEHQDFSTEEEIKKRAEHIADVLTSYVTDERSNEGC